MFVWLLTTSTPVFLIVLKDINTKNYPVKITLNGVLHLLNYVEVVLILGREIVFVLKCVVIWHQHKKVRILSTDLNAVLDTQVFLEMNLNSLLILIVVEK